MVTTPGPRGDVLFSRFLLAEVAKDWEELSRSGRVRCDSVVSEDDGCMLLIFSTHFVKNWYNTISRSDIWK